jgi:hypothetical protein
MKTESVPSEFMLLFRNAAQWHRGLSPEELQNVTEQWMAWYNRLAEQGKMIIGQPLMHTGKIVSGRNGQFIADGPFAESKEAIGGYFILRVATLEDAVQIAQECPGLAYGVTVEVRPIAERCALQEKTEALEQAYA